MHVRIAATIQGTFMGVCVVTAGNIAAEEKNGSAVAGTRLGVDLATVLDVPFATLVAQQITWRATFGSVAVLATRPTTSAPRPLDDPGRSNAARTSPPAAVAAPRGERPRPRLPWPSASAIAARRCRAGRAPSP